LLVLFGCVEDQDIKPENQEIAIPESEASNINNGKVNMITLVLEYEKFKEKIEVNRHQATLNFDNHDPRIAYVHIGKEKMVNLKNFRAENNVLREIPRFVLGKGIKRIEVSHNRIHRLPTLEKNTSLKLLDLSYNKMKVGKDDLRKLRLPPGAVLNITATGINCSYVCDYIKRNPEVNVISDCKCEKSTVVK
jgi:hypothetical protein